MTKTMGLITAFFSTQRKLAARRLGEDFVKAILTEPFVVLPNHEPTDTSHAAGEEEEDDMRVWRNIPDLYTGVPGNIVLRSIVERFWKSCIDEVEIRNEYIRYRVCAVGTPGIGKAKTTPLLLRMLLLQRSTVVYIRRSDDCSSWFYEFVPTPDGEPLEVIVNVYPEESIKSPKIASLSKTSTYYVIDPGKSKDSCDPKDDFQARVIIISSPNEKHWGAGEFEKDYAEQTGIFLFYPLWELSELQRGLEYFYPARLSAQQLSERFRQVGGVPRHLFALEKVYKRILQRQEVAVDMIEEKQVSKIVKGTMDPMGLFGPNSPKSAVIGIELVIKNNFTERKAVPISTAVAELVFFQYIQTLWNDMVDNERPLVFESYLRTVLTKSRYEISLQGIQERGTRTAGRPPVEPPSTIGGYSRIQIVPKGQRISIAAIDNPEANILFYSSDPQYELIDFVCKDSNGNILAFQATTGRTHTVNEAHIRRLEDEVGQRGLMLFYLHTVRPGIRFATQPATPETGFCQIYHVPIPMPIQATPPPDTGVLPAVAAEDPMIE